MALISVSTHKIGRRHYVVPPTRARLVPPTRTKLVPSTPTKLVPWRGY